VRRLTADTRKALFYKGHYYNLATSSKDFRLSAFQFPAMMQIVKLSALFVFLGCCDGFAVTPSRTERKTSKLSMAATPLL
jgi:hypothetical protein